LFKEDLTPSRQGQSAPTLAEIAPFARVVFRRRHIGSDQVLRDDVQRADTVGVEATAPRTTTTIAKIREM